MRKHIPNTVTLLASLCGALAVSFALEGKLEWAGYAILVAAFLDFADGFLARMLNAHSKLGADLDSLADVISFGVAPAAIAYKLLATMLPLHLSPLAYIAFIIVPFSVLRLAIFNNATNQKDSFIGLAVPAHAMLWIGLVFLKSSTLPWVLNIYHPVALIGYVLFFSLLLVSKLSLFSLKFSKENKNSHSKILWLFFILTTLLLFTFQLGGLFFIIILYIGTGLFNTNKKI